MWRSTGRTRRFFWNVSDDDREETSRHSLSTLEFLISLWWLERERRKPEDDVEGSLPFTPQTKQGRSLTKSLNILYVSAEWSYTQQPFSSIIISCLIICMQYWLKPPPYSYFQPPPYSYFHARKNCLKSQKIQCSDEIYCNKIFIRTLSTG